MYIKISDVRLNGTSHYYNWTETFNNSYEVRRRRMYIVGKKDIIDNYNRIIYI